MATDVADDPAHVGMIVVGQFVDVHPLDLDDASTRNMPGGLTSIAAVTDRLRLVGVQPPLEFGG
jgi:hypothetical protein